MKHKLRGVAQWVLIGGVLVLLVVFAGVADGVTCSGTCAGVTCTEQAPCNIAGRMYTLGSACAPGIAGTVCEDNWWPFADCLCADAIGPGNVPKPVCIK